MKYIIEQQNAQAIINYLEGRPFKEVAGLIQILLTLKPIEEEISEDKKEEE